MPRIVDEGADRIRLELAVERLDPRCWILALQPVVIRDRGGQGHAVVNAPEHGGRGGGDDRARLDHLAGAGAAARMTSIY